MLRDLLRKVSYFRQCGEIEIRQVIEQGYRKKLTIGETICREGDPGDSFYIILSGSVEVFVESIDKQVAVRRAGEFIGEMSLLMGTPRTATLRTGGFMMPGKQQGKRRSNAVKSRTLTVPGS